MLQRNSNIGAPDPNSNAAHGSKSPMTPSPTVASPPSPTLPQDSPTLSGEQGVHRCDKCPPPGSDSWTELSPSMPEHSKVYHRDEHSSDVDSLADKLNASSIGDDSHRNSSHPEEAPVTATEPHATRPGVARYDTDAYEDYAPTSPLATPGEELRVSPYAQDHGVSAPTPAPRGSEQRDTNSDGKELKAQRFPNVDPHWDDEAESGGRQTSGSPGSTSLREGQRLSGHHSSDSAQSAETSVVDEQVNSVGGGDSKSSEEQGGSESRE